jgi:hypothetical protein
MEHLPPAGWSHLATKDDISLAVALLRHEMSEMKSELRQEMAEIKADLKADIADVRIAMEKGFRAQTWKMVAAIGTSQAITVAIMAAMVSSLR